MLFFLIVALGAAAVMLQGTARVPGLLDAELATENDAIAILYTPISAGMVLAVLVFTVAYRVLTTRHRRAGRPGGGST